MFDKLKIVAVLTAATLVLVGCTSEADEAVQRLEDYTPDTSLPITQQIAESGVATTPVELSDDEWNYASMVYCNTLLYLDSNPEYGNSEYETADDMLLDEGFGQVWDRAERDTIARIMTTNHCPNRSAK